MKSILEHPLSAEQAGLWYLAKAGYIMRGRKTMLAIAPYLSDSVAKAAPELAQVVPVPVAPEDLQVDVLIFTHDHADHLDLETVHGYRYGAWTSFVAPHLGCRKLCSFGVPGARVVCIDAGAATLVNEVLIRGVPTIPTDPSVSDATGCRIEFRNGRSVYHTSDTGFSEQLLAALPAAQVLLVCINGELSSLNAQEAARLAACVRPKVAIPNHPDMMRPNSAAPASFVAFLREQSPGPDARVLNVLEPFVW